MKVKARAMMDIVSIEKIVDIEEGDDETLANGELESGVYAMDSEGRVWKQVETASAMMQEFTEHDGVKRRRARRSS